MLLFPSFSISASLFHRGRPHNNLLIITIAKLLNRPWLQWSLSVGLSFVNPSQGRIMKMRHVCECVSSVQKPMVKDTQAARQ